MTRNPLRLLLICGLLAFTFVVAACGSDDNNDKSSTSSSSTTPSVEGKKGGVLRMLGASDVDFIDPGRTYYTGGHPVACGSAAGRRRGSVALCRLRTGAGRYHRLERIPVARLTEVFRQAAESRIVVNAHRINKGQMPELPKAGEESDFYFVEINDPEEGVPKIIQMIKERMPRRFGLDPMKDIQVLCPMNRGVLGARNLNIQLQEVLNPNPPAKVERFGWRFSPGDRVMETQNDYDREVFNGDLGTVVRIDDEEGALIASFDGREVSYPFGELDTLVPAYATTIHKSQGSEYPAVIIPVVTQHFTMLARNLLYTGVTRGKRLVVLVGQKKAVGIAVRGGQMKRRWTKLREWLSAT